MANIPVDKGFPMVCVDTFAIHCLTIRSNRRAVEVKFLP